MPIYVIPIIVIIGIIILIPFAIKSLFSIVTDFKELLISINEYLTNNDRKNN